ncbi:MAG TPA: Ig-like domain repeat protein [Acidobacteriaceae bacterium]
MFTFAVCATLSRQSLAQAGRASLTPGIISIVAGGGTPTSGNGDNGQATSASVKLPRDAALDTAGNLYIAESSTNRIRKVTPAGIITTFAGTGTAGIGGNGGLATAATLNGPSSLAFDAAGRLYVTDMNGNDVRVIGTNGIISLVAGTGAASSTGDGGLATAATLNAPSGVVIDATGNIYIGETTGNRIRKIGTDGVISTLAGNGTGGSTGDNGQAASATVNQPRGLALDALGNLYFADYNGHKIRRIDTNGVITTVAGTSSPGFSGDGGLATAAKLYFPRAVNFDAAGNMYIADGTNNRIRKVDTSKIISTVTGGGTACTGATDSFGDGCAATQATLNLPMQAVPDAASNIYIADYNNNLIRKISVTSSLIAFGSQGITTSTIQSVTLVNTGAGSLQFGALTVSGTGFASAASGGTDCIATTLLASGASCQIAIQFTPSALGVATGSVTVTDNSGGVSGTQQTISLTGTGTLATPTVALTVSPTSAGSGQTVVFTAKVTGAGSIKPTGTVQFLNGTTLLGQGTVDGTGTATFSSATLLPGSYSITASYSGDSNFLAESSSPAVSLMVSPQAADTISLTAVPAITTPGQPIMLTANVVQLSGSTLPTGTVTFLDGTTSLGMQNLVAGQAVLSVSSLVPGTHAITAQYSGDASFTPGFSSSVSITVGTVPMGAISPGILSTIAGIGTTGFAGDGGAATAAKLNAPARTAFDAAGNLYIADSGNNVVRKMTTVGVISTFAGIQSKPGNSGDGGLATSASLNAPRDVAVDAAGNVFILDSTYNTVRKVDTTGIITTYAGVPSTTASPSSGDGKQAISATLNQPRAIAVDAQGNLYIAEYAGNVVRKVTTAGIISTYVGTGASGSSGNGGAATSAKLNGPYGINLDAVGRLYIASLGDNTVRKVDTTGIITQVAGTGSGYTGDGGLATAAALSGPRHVATDAGGNIYIADTGNFVVRKVDTNGVITTLAGSHVSGNTGDGGAANAGTFNQLYGVTLDANANLYLADLSANVIRKITVSTGSLTFAAQLLHTTSTVHSATVTNAGGQPLTLNNIALTGATFALAASGGTDCTATTVLLPGASCQIGIVFSPVTLGTLGGQVTITDNSGGVSGSQQVIQLTGFGTLVPTTTSLTITPSVVTKGDFVTFTAAVAITTPPGPGAQPSGTVSFMNGTTVLGTAPVVSGAAIFTTNALLRGSYSVVATYSGDTNFNPGSSSAVALMVNGISSATMLSAAVGSVAQGQSDLLTATISAPGAISPTGTVNFLSGSVIVATATVGAGGIASASVSFLLSGPQAVVASYSGDASYDPSVSTPLLISVTAGPIATLTPGLISTIAGTGSSGYSGDGGRAIAAVIHGPIGGMVVDGSGNLYFPDTSNNCIRKITPSGIITTVAGSSSAGSTGDGGLATSARLSLPRQVAVDAAGNLYIADYYNSRIRKVDTSGIITTLAGTGTSGSGSGFGGDGGPSTAAQLNFPTGVAVDAAGNVYIADTNNQRVRKIDTTGTITTIAGTGTAGFSGDTGPASSAQLSAPSGLAIDSAGNLYIADTNNNRVRKISTAGTITTAAGKAGGAYTGDGGLATAAQLNGPNALAVDAAGDLFISDVKNNVLRKVDATGYISTVAGSNVAGYAGDGGGATAALVTGPTGVGVDALGDIFIADSTNDVLREIIANAGAVNLGTVPFGSSVTATVALSNMGGQPLVLSAITTTGSFSEAPAASRGCSSTGTRSAGSTCLVTITFAPVALGSYTGSLTFTDNSATGTTQTIAVTGIGGKLPPVIALTGSPAAYTTPGTAVTFTAKVSSSTSASTIATGQVLFMNGATTLGTGILDATGTATFSTSALTAATYNVTAVYAGDGSYLNGTSSPLVFSVQNDFTIALSSTSDTVSAGGTVTTTVTITSAAGLLPGTVELGCANQPTYLVCTFSPPTIVPATGPMTSTLTITATKPPTGIGLLGVIFVPLLLLLRKRRFAVRALLAVTLVAGLFGAAGCGSGTFSPTPAVVPITVTVTSGQAMHTVVYNVKVL